MHSRHTYACIHSHHTCTHSHAYTLTLTDMYSHTQHNLHTLRRPHGRLYVAGTRDYIVRFNVLGYSSERYNNICM